MRTYYLLLLGVMSSIVYGSRVDYFPPSYAPAPYPSYGNAAPPSYYGNMVRGSPPYSAQPSYAYPPHTPPIPLTALRRAQILVEIYNTVLKILESYKERSVCCATIKSMLEALKNALPTNDSARNLYSDIINLIGIAIAKENFSPNMVVFEQLSDPAQAAYKKGIRVNQDYLGELINAVRAGQPIDEVKVDDVLNLLLQLLNQQFSRCHDREQCLVAVQNTITQVLTFFQSLNGVKGVAAVREALKSIQLTITSWAEYEKPCAALAAVRGEMSPEIQKTIPQATCETNAMLWNANMEGASHNLRVVTPALASEDNNSQRVAERIGKIVENKIERRAGNILGGLLGKVVGTIGQ